MTETDTIQIQQIRPEYFLNDSLSGFKYDSLPTYLIYDTSIEIDDSQLFHSKFVPANKWISRKDFVSDLSVIVLTISLIIFALIRNHSDKYLSYLFQSIFNYQTAYRLYRERSNTLLHPSVALDLLFFIVFTTFIFNAIKFFINDYIISEAFTFLLIFLSVILYLSVKNGLYRLSGMLFNQQLEVNEFLFHVKSGNKLTAIFLLPISIGLFFSGKYITESLLIIGGIMLVFFILISGIRAFKIISQKGIPIYYLILYLCTLEILPLLLAWRILWSL